MKRSAFFVGSFAAAFFLLMSLSSPAAETSTVILMNENWAKVTVEVRKGNNGEIEKNPSLGKKTLTKGQEWRIESQGESIYYRRDTDPDHPNGKMTVWTHRPVYNSKQT